MKNLNILFCFAFLFAMSCSNDSSKSSGRGGTPNDFRPESSDKLSVDKLFFSIKISKSNKKPADDLECRVSMMYQKGKSELGVALLGPGDSITCSDQITSEDWQDYKGVRVMHGYHTKIRQNQSNKYKVAFKRGTLEIPVEITMPSTSSFSYSLAPGTTLRSQDRLTVVWSEPISQDEQEQGFKRFVWLNSFKNTHSHSILREFENHQSKMEWIPEDFNDGVKTWPENLSIKLTISKTIGLIGPLSGYASGELVEELPLQVDR